MLARGIRIPKRLVEAWVGAIAVRTLPEAQLWSSTFREVDGVGVPARPDLLLLQCSAAEDRQGGPSTRVSRATLSFYRENEHLSAWGRNAQFVLVGSSGSPGELLPLGSPQLWSVTVADLGQTTDDYGRGNRERNHARASGGGRSRSPTRRNVEGVGRSVARS
jgi:hypothetical protein